MLELLQLANFRSFASLEFRPGPTVNFIVGANGQGKTTLLEAAAFLLRLQSPRTSSPAECVRFGASGFRIAGRCAGRSLRVSFAARLRKAWLDEKAPTSLAEYLAIGRVVWISNADRELVTGGGSARRKFLDTLGSQTIPGYLEQLRAYERTLRSRNFLLKDGRPRREIAAFDKSLADAGDFLLGQRERLICEVAPLCAQAHREIAGCGELAMRYLPGAERPLASSLEQSRGEEERLRMTVAGPHRDDFELSLEGNPAAAFASEGQQRSIALALKISQARLMARECGRPPLCLVDDVFGELDLSRRNNLLRALPADSQRMITATSLDWMRERESPCRVFRLEAGKLSERAIQD